MDSNSSGHGEVKADKKKKSGNQAKTAIIGIAVATVAIAGAFAGSKLWHQSPAEKQQVDSKNVLITENSAAAQIYMCPMHPQITSDKPDQTCPICGMDLVLVSHDHQEGVAPVSGRTSITLSDKRRQMIGVKLLTVEKKALFRTVRAPGRAAFDPELYTAQAEYLQALRQFERVKNSPLDSVKENVRRMLESSKVRMRVLGLTDQQIADINASSESQDGLLLYKKGGAVWIYADVHEADLRNIDPGQSVKITANYLEGVTLAGIVASTDQVINPESRTAKVRIKIEKAPVKLRPESYVDVTIYVPQGEHVAIPLDAVVDTGEETFVFVNKKDGILEPVRIQIAFRAGDQVAIAHGLNVGDEIVVSGNFLVDSEAQLKNALLGAQNKAKVAPQSGADAHGN